MNNRLLTRELEITPLGIEFTTNDEINFEIVQSYEYLDEDFERCHFPLHRNGADIGIFDVVGSIDFGH